MWLAHLAIPPQVVRVAFVTSGVQAAASCLEWGAQQREDGACLGPGNPSQNSSCAGGVGWGLLPLCPPCLCDSLEPVVGHCMTHGAGLGGPALVWSGLAGLFWLTKKAMLQLA